MCFDAARVFLLWTKNATFDDGDREGQALARR